MGQSGSDSSPKPPKEGERDEESPAVPDGVLDGIEDIAADDTATLDEIEAVLKF